MHLSRLTDYAIALMTHMAQHPQHAHTASGVAAATHVPVPTAAKLLAMLRRDGLLASTRGVKGGYALARPPAAISATEIVRVVDGPIALTSCIGAEKRGCDIEAICPSRSGMHRLNQVVRDALDGMSLADIAAPAVEIPPALPARAFPKRAHDPSSLQVS